MLLTENAACAAAYAALAVTSFAHSFIQNAYSEPLFTLKSFSDNDVRPEVLAVAVGMAVAVAAVPFNTASEDCDKSSEILMKKR